MVQVIEQFTFSFWKGREIYQCDLPERCANPLEKIAAFFRRRRNRGLTIGLDGVRVLRGTIWGSLFTFSERRHRHEVFIRTETGESGRYLVCEYNRLDTCPKLCVGRRHFFREVQELEAFLRDPRSADDPAGNRALHVPRRSVSLLSFLLNIPLRILYRAYRVFSWFRRRAARRFTPAGVMISVAVAAAAVTGVDTEATVAYQAFTPLLFLLMLAVIFSWVFRVRFSVTRRLPRFGSVGEPLTYAVRLKNCARKTEMGLTLLENLADPRPTFAEWKAVQMAEEKRARSFRFTPTRRRHPFRMATLKEAAVPEVRANEEVEVRTEIVPLRRGPLRFTGVTLARSDPFGLFRAFSRVALPQTVLVLPRRYPLPPIALPGTMRYQEGGVALAASVGQSDEFVALREYRRGDPLRHIHWRSWAKTGKPIVREFEDEFFVRHALVLDTFTTDPRGDVFEEAVSVAASFACTIQIQESLLDLLFVGTQAYCFTAGRGLAHVDQMLEILASVRACGDKPFHTLEHLVLDRLTVVSGCVCVLLAWDAERQAFVEKLKALGLPVLVFIIAEAGHAPLDPGPMRDDPERFCVLEVGQIEEGLARLSL